MSRAAQARVVMDALKKLARSSKRSSLNDLRLLVALERAVARLERHARLRDHLVFKGGFVLLKTLDSPRFTRDVDALAIGLSRNSVEGMVEHALNLDLDDGLWFGDMETTDLKDQGPYGGYRFTCAFQIGDPPKEKAKHKKLSRIHIDLGFGDAVQEMTRKQPMPSILLESKPVSWSVYPMEFIFAEKLEALFSRGSVNSRAKDIYDMPLLFSQCDRKRLLEAIQRTFDIRNTPLPASIAESAEAYDLTVMRGAWKSVELDDDTVTFENTWQELLRCLRLLDTKIQQL